MVFMGSRFVGAWSPQRAAESDVRRRGVDRLALPGGGPEAQAVVRSAQVRAALDDAPRDALAGQHPRRAARVLAGLAVLRGPVIGGPLPHVARHVVQPVAVGREGPNRRG